MANTTFSGPVRAGTLAHGAAANVGRVVLHQSVTINQDGANAVTQVIHLPAGSVILQVLADTDVAWNSATSALLSVGTAAGGTQYVTGVDVRTGGRAVAPHTAAQAAAMRDIGANTAVHCTVTPVGATSAGSTRVHLIYVQTR